MSRYGSLSSGDGPSPPGHRWWRLLRRVLLVMVLLVVAGMWALIGPLPSRMMQARHAWLTAPDDPHPQYFFDGARGTLASEGASGVWTLHASDCQAGQARAFYGVSLADRTNAKLAARIVQPESGGDHITVMDPDTGQETLFARERCARWDVDMHSDGTTYNSIRELAGHARFDCSADHAHVVGEIQLRGCH